MMKSKNINLKKIISITIGIILIINMILFALNKIHPYLFWGIIALGAITAKLIIPKIKD